MTSQAYKAISSLSGNLRGMIVVFVATFGFASAHGMVRQVSSDLHAFEIVFFRNLLGSLVLLPWFIRGGLTPLRTRRLWLHVLRVGISIVLVFAFYMALVLAPLAQVTALSFLGPIIGAFLATLFLGEVVRIRRWTAILFGFVGTFIVLRPGVGTIEFGAVLALASAIGWGFSMTIVKFLSRTESSVTIMSYNVLLMTPLSLLAALFVWQWPTWTHLMWLGAIGLITTAAGLAFTQAIKESEINVVMPLDFFRLIWIAAIGFVVYGEVPTIFTWIGGTMIFASATYIAYRESVLARTASPRDNTVRQT